MGGLLAIKKKKSMPVGNPVSRRCVREDFPPPLPLHARRPDDISIANHGVPNGDFFLASDPTNPVVKFTQADVNAGRVTFRHLGANFGRITLWISDGQYYVTTDLKVRAGGVATRAFFVFVFGAGIQNKPFYFF